MKGTPSSLADFQKLPDAFDALAHGGHAPARGVAQPMARGGGGGGGHGGGLSAKEEATLVIALQDALSVAPQAVTCSAAPHHTCVPHVTRYAAGLTLKDGFSRMDTGNTGRVRYQHFRDVVQRLGKRLAKDFGDVARGSAAPYSELLEKEKNVAFLFDKALHAGPVTNTKAVAGDRRSQEITYSQFVKAFQQRRPKVGSNCRLLAWLENRLLTRGGVTFTNYGCRATGRAGVSHG